MFCPKCGVENSEGANFCRSCGGLITIAATATAAPAAKTSALAITSMVLGILSLIASCLTGLPAIVLGIISLVKISRSKGQLKGTGLAIAGIATSCVLPLLALLMAILMPALSRARFMAQRQVCASNLKQLGVAAMMYAEENNDQYPTADKWCDLLEPYYKNNKVLVCPSAEQGQCHYAINPNAKRDSRSPVNTVLLFESKPGWNLSGGPELLTIENHMGEGCNILFCDGHVEFVKAEDIDELQWTAEP